MNRMIKTTVAALASLLVAGGAMAQTATANSGSQSGAVSVSGSNVSISGSRGYRSTGAAIAPSLAIGGFSCQGSVSAGAGGAGWGVAFGTTVMDRDCNTRENAKVAAAAFGIGTGRLVLCNIEQIRAVAAACQVRQVSQQPTKPRTLFGYNAPAAPVAAVAARSDKPKALTANQIGARQAAIRIKAKIAARELAAN